MNVLTPVALYLGRQKWLPKAIKYVAGLDRLVQGATRSRVTLTGIGGLPGLLLTVRGRKTGVARTTPLLYVPYEGSYLVAGSNFGGPKPPAWALNLEAASEAEVQVRGKRQRVVPRRAVGEERERLWQVMLPIYPNYEKYAERSDREIPVFVLTPTR